MLKINKILKSSLVNGPGNRYTIWFQGCSIHCPGCINPDTWDQTKGETIKVDDLIKDIKQQPNLDGITLTGGEPLDQIDGLLEFLPQIFPTLSIFLISGYHRNQILDNKKVVLGFIDILCSEPFMQDLVDPKLIWMGSSNQILESFTERGKKQITQKPKYVTEIRISKKDGSLLATGFSIPDHIKNQFH